MAKSYDVVIIGAGPAGIFTALELADTGLSILILEKGLDIRERIALNRNRTAPAANRRANIVSGWGGAGAFSDGKLTLTTDYGGNLDDYMNKGELARLISYVDSVYCRFGGEGREVYGDEHKDKIHELKRKAAAADLAFIPARIRHLGTDVNGEILTHMRDSFLQCDGEGRMPGGPHPGEGREGGRRYGWRRDLSLPIPGGCTGQGRRRMVHEGSEESGPPHRLQRRGYRRPGGITGGNL